MDQEICLLFRQTDNSWFAAASASLFLSLARARGEEGGGSAVLLLLVLLLRLKGETCLPPSFFFLFFFVCFFLRLKGETLRKKSSAGRGGSSWDSLKVGKNK